MESIIQSVLRHGTPHAKHAKYCGGVMMRRKEMAWWDGEGWRDETERKERGVYLEGGFWRIRDVDKRRNSICWGNENGNDIELELELELD